MITAVKNEPLEVKLMKMPFRQMLDALSAIDELDQYLFSRLDEIPCTNEAERMLAQIGKRRVDREKFINLRMALELKTISTLHS